jgi:hypothetical protein
MKGQAGFRTRSCGDIKSLVRNPARLFVRMRATGNMIPDGWSIVPA